MFDFNKESEIARRIASKCGATVQGIVSRSRCRRHRYAVLKHWRKCLTALICISFSLLARQAVGQTLNGLWQFSDHKLSNGTEYLILLRTNGSGSQVKGELIFPSSRRLIERAEWNANHFGLIENGGGVVLRGELLVNGVHISELRGISLDQIATPSKGYGAFGAPPLLNTSQAVAPNGLAQTPPMGWNSWNKLKAQVDDASVRQMADAMVASGMRSAGYTYINIDDTWEGVRDRSGRLQPNAKFPDMKDLADYVHSRGLKLGIYSSPGPLTCAGYPGSYKHEQQDAETFAGWGIDYLKYDWCSARYVYQPGEMRAVYVRMGAALAATRRPIVYSLCQYGEEYVQDWGKSVGANLWRTTQDIHDNWKSMTSIGFSQPPLASAAGPSHWNDPDMLEVGNGGMTKSEYQVHLSVWSMLAAPLLAGNDLRDMRPETLSLLLNREVLAVDQDPYTGSVKVVEADDAHALWARQLHGGSVAVALFNRSDGPLSRTLALSTLMGAHNFSIRDLWECKELRSNMGQIELTLPSHAVLFLRLDPESETKAPHMPEMFD